MNWITIVGLVAVVLALAVVAKAVSRPKNLNRQPGRRSAKRKPGQFAWDDDQLLR